MNVLGEIQTSVPLTSLLTGSRSGTALQFFDYYEAGGRRLFGANIRGGVKHPDVVINNHVMLYVPQLGWVGYAKLTGAATDDVTGYPYSDDKYKKMALPVTDVKWTTPLSMADATKQCNLHQNMGLLVQGKGVVIPAWFSGNAAENKEARSIIATTALEMLKKKEHFTTPTDAGLRPLVTAMKPFIPVKIKRKR